MGGYVLLVTALLPKLEVGQDSLQEAVLRAIRMISLCGALTTASGLLLIAYTRGYAAFGKGEWGGSVAGALLLATVLMGISDGLLRPAVRRLSPSNPRSLDKAKHWAAVSLALDC